MTDRPSLPTLGGRPGFGLTLGLVAVLTLFVVSGVISYYNVRTLSESAGMVAHTHEVLSALNDILSLSKDAETGQRGYLLTGDERYLAPHTVAKSRLSERIADIERMTRDNSIQQMHIPTLKSRLDVKIKELDETIHVRRAQGLDAALSVVQSDRGKEAMDAIRTQVEVMQLEEKRLRTERLAGTAEAYQVAVTFGIVTGVLGVVLSIAVATLLHRTAQTREREAWLQAGQIGIGDALTGDPRLELLGEKALRFLAEYLDAQAGAFFAQDEGVFRRLSTYGVPVQGTPAQIEPGDRLLGQAIKDVRTFVVRDVPVGYLQIGSALGTSKPRDLLIVPFAVDGVVNAVAELGFVRQLDDLPLELFERVSDSVGVAIQSANFRTRLQNLLEETQRQAEELQVQSEELRVSNEELEEQGRALRESQARLELQQTELEQTNSQLEEQAQQLEVERDDASQARAALQVQTQELEQASRYKSDFLANMSHELRTPLNSSLILAKLLADNPHGNLSTEQVKYAETIRSAGNDLLALINDILDLSKIEAGHVDVRPESFGLLQLLNDLERTFKPMAVDKGLNFRLALLPGCAATMVSDRQRLDQILKNLLANAIKFTERGEVSLTISRTEDARLAFAVTDSGIGIPAQQQRIVFEAFRQADGTTNRKYGGTGLGLSISRELTRLLGGDIHLASEAGRGSTFTVTLPEVFDATRLLPSAPPASPHRTEWTESARLDNPPPVGVASAAAHSVSGRPRISEDDRGRLTGNDRVILVVEDDEPFSRILYDLVHELDFQCLIANTAEEGLAVAVQYLPSAVVLDVGLPDHSGLSVLDRLKRDTRTRHIPVHVVSAGDYAQTAFSLGAVGYMLKPVKREELVEVLQNLETRLAQRMRSVLVVEDDPVQRESLQKLLGSHDVKTVGAGTAAECLALLKEATFDCMVLDLSLPDATGYSILETLSREDAYSFPPVIVYTGRDLLPGEEQRLRRYSKSIIIKGAKSPERLLDEVTLFLHQVVAELPQEQQKMLEQAKSRDAALEGRRILVVEDDVRNVFALTSIFEPRGAQVQIARNGREGLEALERAGTDTATAIDLVLMDVMMPEMDGITATREIRKRPEWKKLPVIMLTAKAMKDDQEQCLSAGANDYVAKPLDVEKLLSLVRVWMPR